MEVGGAARSLVLLPLKSRSGAILMLFCGFFDCIIENHSNAELYLLLPEHRGEKCREWSGSLGGDASGDDGLGCGELVMMIRMPLVMVLVIFGFRK